MKRCEIRLLKKTCKGCHERRAHFRYSGRVKWDPEHNLCFQCFRAVRDRVRSLSLARQRVVWPMSESADMFVLTIVGTLTVADTPSSNLLDVTRSLERQSDSQEVCIGQPAL
jgi:hypothetical protein